MTSDDEILTEQGKKDLRRAAKWCLMSWGCLVGGLGFGLALSLLEILSLSLIGVAIFAAGLLFSVYAAFLGFLGILFPGKSGRTRFACLFCLSIFSFVAMTFAISIYFRSPH